MSDDEYVRDPTTGQEYTIRRGNETIIGDVEVTGRLTNNGAAVGGEGVGSSVVESEISLSDNTTNNASTTKHGFLKKLSNVATEFMNGAGNWASLVLPVKASGAETDTGTDDAKFLTPKALEDSDYIKEADLPPGGITNSAPANTIPLSDGTNLVDSDITWLDDELTFNAEENATVQILVAGLGSQLHIKAADGDATHVGGEVVLGAGAGDGENNGGDFTASTGAAAGEGDSGSMTLQTGAATDGADGGGSTGSINIRPGSGTTADSQGGSVNISGGNGRTGGGSVIVNAGGRTVSGSWGTVQLFAGEFSNSIELSNTALSVAAPIVDLAATTSINLGTPVVNVSDVLKLAPQAFASLPVAPEEGMMAWVNDSNTAVWGATIADGGANKVLAVFNGTTWTVAGK